MVAPEFLSDLLEERRQVGYKAQAEFASMRASYSGRDQRVRIMDALCANDWAVLWPDQKKSVSIPKIANLPVIAAENRGRLVSQTPPTIICRPEKGSDSAKALCEQRERVIGGWWQRNRLMTNMSRWSVDLEYTGLAVCKTMPDYVETRKEYRFPVYTRIDPRFVYPYPIFSDGPFLDNCIIAYEESATSAYARFGQTPSRDMLAGRPGMSDGEHVRIIEFYDDTQCVIIAEARFRGRAGRRPFQVLMALDHNIGRCPITVGVRAGSHDGAYRGSFDHVVSILNTHNRMMTYALDASEEAIYSALAHYGFDDSEMRNYGPGAVLEANTPDFRIEFPKHPSAGFDNQRMLAMMADTERVAALLPDSATGNPDESVISAAGIAATQSMPNALVVSLQRDSIAPMLQAANEVAMRGDEQAADVTKSISGESRGSGYVETYLPSKVFNGNYSNEVRYGRGAGVDQATQHVHILQDLGAGTISKQTAMENDPYVDNPQREKAQMVKEQMQDVGLASIMAATQLPEGAPGRVGIEQLAAIWDDIDKGETIQQALKNHVERVALIPPPPMAPQGGALASPGIPGAAEPTPPPFTGAPPVSELTG